MSDATTVTTDSPSPSPGSTDAPALQPGQTPAPGATETPAGGTQPATLAGGATPAPTAPAASADGQPGTLAGGTAPDTRLEVKATWPDNWRQELAAGDEKALKRLERMGSPADVFKAYRELEGKLSSGKLRAAPEPLAADATPEQVAAWRSEQGLPADADSFVKGLELPQGVIPGEADKPLLADFAAAATKANWTQEQYNQAIGWYYGLQDRLLGEQQQADADYHIASTQELQREWGTEFKQNINRVTQFFDKFMPKDFADALRSARLPDGSIAGNSPAFNRAFAELSRAYDPAGTVLPNVPGATMANVESRISEIETKHMRAPYGSADWKAYHMGEAGAKMQQEYRSLLEARIANAERQRGA